MTDSIESIRRRIEQTGTEAYGPAWKPVTTVRAPGRIEVIGNHVDYNGGPVLAAAIDREIHIAGGVISRPQVRVLFADSQLLAPITIEPGALVDWRLDSGEPQPADYLRGVIASLTARHLPVRSGLDLVVAGNLPPGLGISSSAALCVGLTLMVANVDLAEREVVLIAQDAEHRVGSPCGTMDQSASIAGGLIAYSGAETSFEPMPADLGDYLFVVINSGIERHLATSSYPERVRESHAALAIIQEEIDSGIRHVAEIDPGLLGSVERVLTDRGEPALAARVRHVVTETSRVHEAVAASARGDWREVGRLMAASGKSSSTDYEISHPAVEEIVRISLDVSGVLGARMMGGGEGGAALALVHRNMASELEQTLERDYFVPRGLTDVRPKFVPCTFAPGATVVG